LSKQLTATLYVKAIGESLVKTVENDTMKSDPTSQTIPLNNGAGPVNVQSYIAQRHKSSRTSLPVPRTTMYQSHRSKDAKPVGLRSYVAIREKHAISFDAGTFEDALEEDIISKEDGWDTFDSLEDTKDPKFVRVANETTHTANHLNHSSPVNNIALVDADEYTDEVDTVATYYNDGDESFALKYVTEIPLLPPPSGSHTK
jgi:hypothetical protein